MTPGLGPQTRAALPLVLCFFFASARAHAGPVYPMTARIRMAPRDQQRCPALGKPSDCGVLGAVEAAFRAVLPRLFESGDRPEIELLLQVRTAEVIRVFGPQLELSTRVRAASASGEMIDEIDSATTAPLLSDDDAALANAARNAADDLARLFERSILDGSKLSNYVLLKKAGSPEVVALRERSDRLVSLAGALGVGQGGDDALGAMASVRAGLAWKWLLLQASYSRFDSSFRGVVRTTPTIVDSELTTNDFGVDAGGVYRFTPTIELRGGPGIHFLFGGGSQGSTSDSFTKLVPELFASISKSFLVASNTPRFTVGAEARGYFFSSVGVPQLLRTVPAANASFLLFLGVELPWPTKETR